MELDLLEIELADYLNSKIGTPNRDIIPLPETQSEFEKPLERNKVTVMFVNEKGSPNQTIGAIGQEITIQWGFVIQSNKLRGAEGVHQLASLVKSKMLGYRPTDCDPLYYVGHDFVNFMDNEWEHRVLFESKTFRAQIGEDPTDQPLLKSVTFQEP